MAKAPRINKYNQPKKRKKMMLGRARSRLYSDVFVEPQEQHSLPRIAG
jgi:hypothetical protein